MRRINKGSPPASFITYSKSAGAAFETMPANVKDDLKMALLNEQGWVCGYCQRRVVDKSRMKIEHFCEQSICNGENGMPDSRLDYGNLLAVCLGDAGYNGLHCDSSKSQFGPLTGLPIAISPWNPAHMAALEYRSSGRLISTISRHDWELNEILNLNMPLLRDQRRLQFSNVFAQSKHLVAGRQKEKMRRILVDLLGGSGEKFANDFPGMYEFMLHRYCE